MVLLVMADLEMLVCDKANTDDVYNNDFYEHLLLLTETYELWVNQSQAKWLFSSNLENQIWEAYPWNTPIHNDTDLYTLFAVWMEHNDNRKIVTVNRLTDLALDPNIHANYVTRDYPDLDKEWRNVLANCGEVDSKATIVIFSFAGKPNQVTLIDLSNNTRKTFPLVKNEPEWLTELKKIDPWLRHQLPKSGDYPYEPPDPNALDFPQEYYPPRDAKGFKDNKGRLWVPDEERNQRHWDVQCKERGRDKYFKVSPDGRLLEGKPC